MEKLNNKMRTIIILLFISSFSLLLSFWGDYNGNVLNIIIAYTDTLLGRNDFSVCNVVSI